MVVGAVVAIVDFFVELKEDGLSVGGLVGLVVGDLVGSGAVGLFVGD